MAIGFGGPPPKPRKPKAKKPAKQRGPFTWETAARNQGKGGKKLGTPPKGTGFQGKAFSPVGVGNQPAPKNPKWARGSSQKPKARPQSMTGGNGQNMMTGGKGTDGRIYGPPRPYGPYRPGPKWRKKKTTGTNPRSTGGSGSGAASGGGGGGGGAASVPAASRASGSGASSGASTTTTNKPGTTTDDALFDSVFGPARRELDRQRAWMDSMRQQAQAAWDTYGKWAEEKRAQTAGLLTQTQKDQQATYDIARKQSDQQIAQFVDQARGGAGVALGSDLAHATGNDVLAQAAAANTASGDVNSGFQRSEAARMQQYMADQQGVNNAFVKQGTENQNYAWAQAANALARKQAELEQTYGQAKLDKFYRDRQFGLDRETLDWTKSLQKGQLDVATTQANTAAKKLVYDQQYRTEKLRLDTLKANNKISNDQYNLKLRVAKEGASQRNITRSRGTKAMAYVKGLPSWGSGDAKMQGENMRQAGSYFFAQEIPFAMARKYMLSLYGSRFDPAAQAEFANIYGR